MNEEDVWATGKEIDTPFRQDRVALQYRKRAIGLEEIENVSSACALASILVTFS